MRRGDIRLLLLTALLDGPAHGYELMGRLETRSGGEWRPSAGSVYPTLQLLEEQGLVVGSEDSGKRVFTLTATGRTEAEAAREREPAAAPADGDGPPSLRDAVAQLGLAARQVSVAGEPAQLDAAIAIVTEARQRLYRLLAGD
jgi:DNA-binding PadR family transcriptional regulator